MEMCEDSKAKFMGTALLNHAKDIARYAKTYSEPFFPNIIPVDEQRDKFIKSVNRMIQEMHALLGMAQNKGIARYCNFEQIEAYIEEAVSIVECSASTGGNAKLQTN